MWGKGLRFSPRNALHLSQGSGIIAQAYLDAFDELPPTNWQDWPVTRQRHSWSLPLVVCLLASPWCEGQESEAPSFSHEVMAVLSKNGCNMGTCHGNFNGKGGFRLSLRGEDPATDARELTRGWSGRRTNRLEPDASLLLLKPTMAVAHEGGQRLEVDSVQYAILRDWIANGMPVDRKTAARVERIEVDPIEAILVDPIDEVRIRVQAFFSDGAQRDVTHLAVFEPNNQLALPEPDGTIRRGGFGEVTIVVRYLARQLPVRLAWIPDRPDYQFSDPESQNLVDQHIDRKLQRLTIEPAPVCDDTTFLRRSTLDLLGVLPTAEEARAFLADSDPDKRSRWIEHLLARPEFADYWAYKWADLLKNEEKVLDRKGVQNFHAWIRQSLLENRPFDEFVRAIVSGKGSTYHEPASNFYRANRDSVSRAETTAQLFLGTRLQCAKCHNHPFDRWTQDDYYNWTALFSGVDYKVLENDRRDRNDKHEFRGEQLVVMHGRNDVKNPASGGTARAQFLGGPQAEDASRRLDDLAEWLTQPDNTRFVQSQTNRIWYHLMGRGIVDPIDDFRGTNPPANPELLDALSLEFTESGFDLRHMIRLIMNSKAYQRSNQINESNAHDELNFSRAFVRRIEAEPLLDALHQVCDVPSKFAGYPAGLRATQLPGVRAFRPRDRRDTPADLFLTTFGKPPRLISCECERSNETTLVQTFEMLSGPLVDRLIGDKDNRIGRLLERELSDSEIAEHFYWTALSRPPTPEEHKRVLALVGEADDRRSAWEDVLWGLLNSKEFLLRY